MQITLFDGFSKRSNSTLRPSSGGVTVSCVLKDDTSMQNPTFILKKAHKGNYIKWDNNYYFVNDVVYLDNERVELSCSIDLLATYRNEVGSFRGYIARCEAGYDADIPDNCASYTYKWKRVRINHSSGSAGFSDTLYSVIHCLSQQGDTMSINPYYFDEDNKKIVSELMSLTNANGLIEKYKTTTVDPTKYITRIFDIPWRPTLGNYIFNVCGFIGSEEIITATSIPKGSTQSSQVVFHIGEALESYEPQSKAKCTCHLYLPFYGIFDFTPKYVGDSWDSIDVRVYKDDTTGDVAYLILNGGEYIGKVTCNASTESSLGSYQYKNAISGVVGASMSVAGVVAGVSTANPIGVASGIMGYAQNLVSATTPSITVCGGLGSNVDRNLGLEVLLMVDIPEIVNIDYAGVCGRPLNKVDTISTHGGFVQTAGANISLPMFSREVSTLLDNGVFYE